MENREGGGDSIGIVSVVLQLICELDETWCCIHCTYMETEFSTVVMVCQTEVRCRGCPQSTRTISIPLVLLEQFKVLEK